MSVTHVVGIDPGLVHTGVVSMLFLPDHHVVQVEHEAINGVDLTAVVECSNWITNIVQYSKPTIFIEGYRPRSHLNNDRRMQDGVTRIRQATGGTVLDNMGIKKVVHKALMELLGVWLFSTTTHHQDLRSAARIAILGMLKDDAMNRLLADIVRDHLAGSDWRVVH